ncbi:MAG: hypothetical protein VKO64_00185 [Candidatus Sericytochromatia bacterium]|nr:hypothetical protein [Candidatus Sericytochromatia bacterium]
MTFALMGAGCAMSPSVPEQDQNLPADGARETQPFSEPPDAPMPLPAGQRDTFVVEGGPLGLAQGGLELEVLERQARDGGLDVRAAFVRTGLLGAERKEWIVRMDASGMRVDGKPFLPWRARPGDRWEAQAGSAILEDFEDLQVPSGHASKVWRVRFTEPGQPDTRWWFAPGRGLVQAEFSALGSTVVALHSRRVQGS